MIVYVVSAIQQLCNDCDYRLDIDMSKRLSCAADALHILTHICVDACSTLLGPRHFTMLVMIAITSYRFSCFLGLDEQR